MARSKDLVQLCVYVDDAFAQAVRQAAASQGLTVSKFLKAVLARDVGIKSSTTDPGERALGYISVGIDALLDQHDPKLREAVRRVHEKRFGSASDGH